MRLPSLDVLYEDNHILVVLKPAGGLMQGDQTGDVSLLDLARQWLIEQYQKPGNAFVGLVHRLDRPVGGVVVFAKTSKAASRLSIQFRERAIQKSYLAVIEGALTPVSATLTHYIKKRPGNRRVHIFDQPTPDADSASLTYTVLETLPQYSLVQVQLHTGRHHQIRAQLEHLGHPIVGDHKYGAHQILPDKDLALFAFQLGFQHPTRQEKMLFQSPPPEKWPWTLFQAARLG
jgi:23S rRNA pseudouridine1911/1915/1917 synthase